MHKLDAMRCHGFPWGCTMALCPWGFASCRWAWPGGGDCAFACAWGWGVVITYACVRAYARVRARVCVYVRLSVCACACRAVFALSCSFLSIPQSSLLFLPVRLPLPESPPSLLPSGRAMPGTPCPLQSHDMMAGLSWSFSCVVDMVGEVDVSLLSHAPSTDVGPPKCGGGSRGSWQDNSMCICVSVSAKGVFGCLGLRARFVCVRGHASV